MIIVINGPFGVCKSTTAHLLVQRLPNSFVYDPELIGFVLRRVGWPLIRVRDYQDLAVWRGLTTCRAWVLRRTTRTLVVPVAVWRLDRWAQFLGGLRYVDPDVRCFRLTASDQTLRVRIIASDDHAARDWRLDHLVSGLAAAANPTFGIEVDTEGCTPTDVVDTVIHLLAAGDQRR